VATKSHKTLYDTLLDSPRFDIELIIERDSLSRVTKIGYTVRQRKNDKAFAEFQEIVKRLIPDLDPLVEAD
jgi:hypothetical protein